MEGIQTRDGLYGFEFRDIDKRRAEEGERKTYDAKQMWQRHHEVANLLVQGFKQTEIAEILNIHPQTVSNIANGELVKHKISEMRMERDEDAKKTAEKIRVLTNKAIATYHEIFDNESGEATLRDRKDVADTVLLELSGLRVPTKVQSQSITTVLSREELESFKNRGKKAAEEIGIIIDVTPADAPERCGESVGTEPNISESSQPQGEKA